MGAAFSGEAATLEACKELGWLVGKVELYHPASKMRSDLFGFADLAAIVPGKQGTTYIQATVGSHGRDRIRKIMGLDASRVVLKAGNTIEVWAWRLYKDSDGMFRDAIRWEITRKQRWDTFGVVHPGLLEERWWELIVRDLPSYNELYNKTIGGEIKRTEGVLLGAR